MGFFKSEPVMTIATTIAIGMPLFFELLASFDVALSVRQVAAVTALVTFLAGVYQRSRVSPVRPT